MQYFHLIVKHYIKMSLCCLKESILALIIGGISYLIFKRIFNYLTYEKIYKSLKEKHVVITGGSSGIGLSLAKLAYQHGAHITILGRNLEKLKNAEVDICSQKLGQGGTVEIVSVDICSDYESLKKCLENQFGKTDILINCAGGAISRTFLDTSPSEIESQVHLNYLGSAMITKLFLPSMIESKSDSYIAFVSSMAGQVGLFGYGAYSASKFALRGLAESLRMEVGHRGVHVTLAFPPDTRTPGYENEQIGKPETTKKLSEASGLIEPEHVAKCIWVSVLSKQFFSSVGLDGWFLTAVTYGMCLPDSVLETVALILLAPLTRIVAVSYGLWMRCVVRATDKWH